MSGSYKALGEPLQLEGVGPDGAKRSIHAFPSVLGFRFQRRRGLEAFKLHLPAFLEKPLGDDASDPDFGSSLHALLDSEDPHQSAEILRRVVRDELSRRFGKYLDVIHSFDVTVHRETRTMAVSTELRPHGAEKVSWSFELRFPPRPAAQRLGGRPPASPQAENDPRAAEFIRIARHHYPAGFPLWEDDLDEPVPAYQRTAEYQRWRAAWEEAQQWTQWDGLMEELHAAFPGFSVSDVTYPFADANLRCCVYPREPVRDGERALTRVAGAVSVLAPVYLVYVTTRTLRSDGTATPSRLTFEPTGEARLHADTLARHIERVLGYRPFPMELADVPLPGLRVDFLHEPPTLLGALFDARDQLDNLP
jgi:hypothetical protein